MNSTRYFAAITLALFLVQGMGCGVSKLNPLTSTNSSAGVKASNLTCAAILMIPGFEINFTAPSTLPLKLAVAINDKAIAYDDCTASTPSLLTGVRIQRQQQNLQIAVSLDGFSHLFSSYFAHAQLTPIRSEVSFRLYGRKACNDELALLYAREDVPIGWKKVTYGDPACENFSYSGTAQAR